MYVAMLVNAISSADCIPSHPQPEETPKVFIVRLTLGGEIRFVDNRLLARHLGIDYPANDASGYRAWDTLKGTWTFHRYDHAFRPPLGTDFAILRHEDNKEVLSLGFFLEKFEMHRKSPVSVSL